MIWQAAIILALFLVAPASASERVTAGASFTVPVGVPADQAFVLFDPVGERTWAHDWNPRFTTDPAPMRAGLVFETEPHGGRPARSVWLVDAYDAAQRTIRYVVVEPAYQLTVLEIRVEPRGPKAAEAAVHVQRTALVPEADGEVAASAAHAAATGTTWAHAIAAALRKP